MTPIIVSIVPIVFHRQLLGSFINMPFYLNSVFPEQYISNNRSYSSRVLLFRCMYFCISHGQSAYVLRLFCAY